MNTSHGITPTGIYFFDRAAKEQIAALVGMKNGLISMKKELQAALKEKETLKKKIKSLNEELDVLRNAQKVSEEFSATNIIVKIEELDDDDDDDKFNDKYLNVHCRNDGQIRDEASEHTVVTSFLTENDIDDAQESSSIQGHSIHGDHQLMPLEIQQGINKESVAGTNNTGCVMPSQLLSNDHRLPVDVDAPSREPQQHCASESRFPVTKRLHCDLSNDTVLKENEDLASITKATLMNMTTPMVTSISMATPVSMVTPVTMATMMDNNDEGVFKMRYQARSRLTNCLAASLSSESHRPRNLNVLNKRVKKGYGNEISVAAGCVQGQDESASGDLLVQTLNSLPESPLIENTALSAKLTHQKAIKDVGLTALNLQGTSLNDNSQDGNSFLYSDDAVSQVPVNTINRFLYQEPGDEKQVVTYEMDEPMVTSDVGTTKDIFIDTGNNKEAALKCSYCNKTFSQQCTLEAHVRLHTRRKPYQCETCGKSFSWRSGLDTHLRSHTGEKPYHCNICSKDFSQKSGLEAHRRMHTGEKPYACPVCAKTFSWKSSLEAHRRIHACERAFKCKVCTRTFNMQNAFLKHLKTHRTYANGDLKRNLSIAASY